MTLGGLAELAEVPRLRLEPLIRWIRGGISRDSNRPQHQVLTPFSEILATPSKTTSYDDHLKTPFAYVNQ
jgi:hypothetical protein